MAAQWIWYYGDFELYHHALLSCRRQELGFDYPCMWRVARPELNVTFYRRFEAAESGTFRVHTHSKGFVAAQGIRRPINAEVPYEAGKLEIEVQLYDLDAFPSFYIDGELVKTDGSWTAHCGDKVWKPVGCSKYFTAADDDPRVFPFRYEVLTPCSVKETDGGRLYDFGKEYFGTVTFGKIADDDEITLIYGESEEEAADFENAIVREKLTAADCAVRPARAFRYIYIKSRQANDIHFTAQYEYLPLEDKAHFTCDDEKIEKIWNICSHTFHLNSREFFLDGIKRDRWVWSGDAYQSFIINRYLFDDRDITKRTILALLGKPEYTCHINTINDYSSFLIIAIWEYCRAYGDTDFAEAVFGKVKALYDFTVSRLGTSGYVIKQPNDWIFIDWGDVDKSGTLCAEQILLHEASSAMAKLCEIAGSDGAEYADRAKHLKEAVIRDYWRADRNAFIDCFDGKNGEHISRQTNVLAIMFDFVDTETALKIKENVLDNNEITPITTPYFKLYELIARCKCGDIENMQRYLSEYWGGMLQFGATSVWEQYDPSASGITHYGMYGKKFDKSLCHAWGSGPIYLLGRFCAGVQQTGTAYKTFKVAPQLGIFGHFDAEVPINGRTVRVKCSRDEVTVFTDAEGGTLVRNGREYDIPANKEFTVKD